MKFFTRLLCVLGLTSAAQAGEVPLHEGDCWSYHTRPGEEASFIVIRKIEHFPKAGEVVHMSIFGLHMKNPHTASGSSSEIPHMPISVESLRRSLIKKLSRQAPECDWQSGYNIWRDANAGAFTESVNESVKFTEDTLNHGKPQA